MAKFGITAAGGDPPDVVGAALAWLATAGHADTIDGSLVSAQQLCGAHGLVPGWEPATRG